MSCVKSQYYEIPPFQWSAPPQSNDMAEWVKREHRKGEIDRIGQRLLPWWKTSGAMHGESFRIGVQPMQCLY